MSIDTAGPSTRSLHPAEEVDPATPPVVLPRLRPADREQALA